MYDLEQFIKFLGNPLDGTSMTNVMYFSSGFCRSRSVSIPEDIPNAERFIRNHDGRYQLYLNINPSVLGTTGKPSDADIPAVRNLYVDIDAVKALGAKDCPAKISEISDIPIKRICDAINRKYSCTYVDATGNGFRAITNVNGDATQQDEIKLVHYLYKLFPEYIDRSVVDQSRITGVPGTMNVKSVTTETRQNRRRDVYTGDGKRAEQVPATYLPDELPPASEMRPKPASHHSIHVPHTNAVGDPMPVTETQRLLNAYVRSLAQNAPYILDVITADPGTVPGYEFDAFMVSEILHKVGNAPAVFHALARHHWGEEYDFDTTQRVWDHALTDSSVWSERTIRRVFNVK